MAHWSKTIHFIDLETSHLQAPIGEILEVAILTSFDRGYTIHEKFVKKVKMDKPDNADPVALRINGYSEEEWISAGRWISVASQIQPILKRGICVAHNVTFDYGWLREKMEYDLGMRFSSRWVCTLSLALEHLPFLKSHSLKSLSEFFNIPSLGTHRALNDALMVWRLYSILNRADMTDRFKWRIKWELQNRKR